MALDEIRAEVEALGLLELAETYVAAYSEIVSRTGHEPEVFFDQMRQLLAPAE